MRRCFPAVLLATTLAWSGWPGVSRAAEHEFVTEYVGLEINSFSLGWGDQHSNLAYFYPGQACIRAYSLHWLLGSSEGLELVFTLTTAELLHGFLAGPGTRGALIFGGTEPGLMLRFGDRRQAQIGLGLGIGAGWWYAHIPGSDGVSMGGEDLMFAPSLRFRHQFESITSLGLGLRVVVPAVKQRYGPEYGPIFSTFFEVGFSDWSAESQSSAEPAQAGAGPRGE